MWNFKLTVFELTVPDLFLMKLMIYYITDTWLNKYLNTDFMIRPFDFALTTKQPRDVPLGTSASSREWVGKNRSQNDQNSRLKVDCYTTINWNKNAFQ